MHIKFDSLNGTRLKVSFSIEDSLLGLQGFAGLKRISCPQPSAPYHNTTDLGRHGIHGPVLPAHFLPWETTPGVPNGQHRH